MPDMNQPSHKRAKLEDGSAAHRIAAPTGSAAAAIHADALAEQEGNLLLSTDWDVSPALSLSTTFYENEGGHVYARLTNPNRTRCELLLASVEGTETCPCESILFATGLSATFTLLARLMPSRVAISAGGYHGTHKVLEQIRRISGGKSCEAIPLPPPERAASELKPGDLVWLETPLNPTCDIADIAAYVEATKELEGSHVIVDGTFAPPPLQRPLTLGAHAVVHATTKYLAGHSDAMGGAVCVTDPVLAKNLREDRGWQGTTPGALEVWLLLRSLRTLHVRVERQSKTATSIAGWLHAATTDQKHPLFGYVHDVHHASLPSNPGHKVALKQMKGSFGACLAVELKTEAAAKALTKSLHLFRDATSLGGVESLVEWRRKYDSQISPLLLRLSIGLEEEELLKADLQRAILEVSRPPVETE